MTTPDHSSLPRLDVLLYGHDGRGLGHVARSVGIGMALRRCYPQLKVLFISGSSMTGEMVAGSNLDWMKLPSYKTRVVGGKSRGVDGDSGLSDHDLGLLRTKQLEDIVKLYRPRLVLADHAPQGKHRELVQAISWTENSDLDNDIRWILGVRGVVGDVPQAGSELGRELFTSSFDGLLWYGDSQVLGPHHLEELKQFYGLTPVECGYVSRMYELTLAAEESGASEEKTYAGTISIPWMGERGGDLVRELAVALDFLGTDHGSWKLFVPLSESKAHRELAELFERSDCEIEQPSGFNYVKALRKSRTALIYGGYNSLMDVVSLRIPGLAVMRPMMDNEQQLHLEKLAAALDGSLSVIEEQEASAQSIADALLLQLNRQGAAENRINLNGAEQTAHYIYRMLNKVD